MHLFLPIVNPAQLRRVRTSPHAPLHLPSFRHARACHGYLAEPNTGPAPTATTSEKCSGFSNSPCSGAALGRRASARRSSSVRQTRCVCSMRWRAGARRVVPCDLLYMRRAQGGDSRVADVVLTSGLIRSISVRSPLLSCGKVAAFGGNKAWRWPGNGAFSICSGRRV